MRQFSPQSNQLVNSECVLDFGIYLIDFVFLIISNFNYNPTFEAVQNERQPRNTATIKPESLREMDGSKVLREHSSLVGIFGY